MPGQEYEGLCYVCVCLTCLQGGSSHRFFGVELGLP